MTTPYGIWQQIEVAVAVFTQPALSSPARLRPENPDGDGHRLPAAFRPTCRANPQPGTCPFPPASATSLPCGAMCMKLPTPAARFACEAFPSPLSACRPDGHSSERRARCLPPHPAHATGEDEAAASYEWPRTVGAFCLHLPGRLAVKPPLLDIDPAACTVWRPLQF